MGIGKVNKRFGVGQSHTRNQNIMRTAKGQQRYYEHMKNESFWPMWIRVLYGNLAAEGYGAQMRIGQMKKARIIRQKARRRT